MPFSRDSQFNSNQIKYHLGKIEYKSLQKEIFASLALTIGRVILVLASGTGETNA